MPTPNPTPTPAPKTTLRQDIMKMYGPAGETALNMLGKGTYGVKFVITRDGPVATLTNNPKEVEMDGQKFSVEDFMKVLDVTP